MVQRVLVTLEETKKNPFYFVSELNGDIKKILTRHPMKLLSTTSPIDLEVDGTVTIHDESTFNATMYADQICVAWGYIQNQTGTYTILDSFNIESVAQGGAPSVDMEITFTNALPSSNYVVLAAADNQTSVDPIFLGSSQSTTTFLLQSSGNWTTSINNISFVIFASKA